MSDLILKIAATVFLESVKTCLPPEVGSDIQKVLDDVLVAEIPDPDAVRRLADISQAMSQGISPDDWEPVSFEDHKTARLIPVFEAIFNPRDRFSYTYPLEKLTPDTLFPTKTRVDEDEADQEYQALFHGFSERLGSLANKDRPALWLEHFESLMMLYLSAIPAPGYRVSNVSLFDHAKISSAIATAIWRYHGGTIATGDPDALATDTEFLFVSGGLGGIQKFIFKGYGESRKFRSKLLRGRSFAVSLFSELAADMLCRALDLPTMSVLFNTAGRFMILAPNTPECADAVKSADRKMNEWLLANTFGETMITISTKVGNGEVFERDEFQTFWTEIEKEKEKKKFSRMDLNRYGGVLPELSVGQKLKYLENFNTDLNNALCAFCGKRPAVENRDDRSICGMCKDHVFLGKQLVKRPRMAVFKTGGETVRQSGLTAPIYGEYQVRFVGADELPDADLLKLWDLSGMSKGDVAGDLSGKPISCVTAKFINGYVPEFGPEDQTDPRVSEEKIKEVKEMAFGDPKSLNIIACKAKHIIKESDKTEGIAALGVFKADVDDLGFLIACGIPKERLTAARLSTLSRQVHCFFAVYLPYLLGNEANYQDVYTVFAGGDDLFLIGPWNRIVDLAAFLNSRFTDYVCHNKNMHFSAGISFHKPHTPIDVMARTAEEALHCSKTGDPEKNRVTVFSETVTWVQMDALSKIRPRLWEWLNDDIKTMNPAMLFRLNRLMEMAEEEKRFNDEAIEEYRDMSCAKWRALLAYTVARNAAKGETDKDKRNKIVHQVVETVSTWLSEHGGKLKISVWDILYNTRK